MGNGKKLLSIVSVMVLFLAFVNTAHSESRFPTGARYLIIAPDSFYNALVPLAEWKTRKGMLAKIVKLSETGYSASEIKAYIQNAYNTWDPPPEYVLLVGDADSIPFVTVSGVRTDCYYTNMDADFYNEIIPGRFPAVDIYDVQNFVNKVLHYEREPYMDDTLWFRKATGIIRIDNDESDSIYWSDIFHAESLMIDAGFIQFDKFSDTAGYDANDVYAAIENGRSYVTFRGSSVCGWWSPFDVEPELTNPGLKLPVVVSTTCGQVNSDFTCGSGWVRAGTVDEPRGAVAFCGPTTVITGGAYKRSALNRGFFDYVFVDSGDSIATFGKAVEAGRVRYYELYYDYSEYYGFQCIGDPELNLWTSTPRPMTVNYPSAIPSGPYNLTVHVEDNGCPIPYALVCAMKDTSIYTYGYTDASGNVTLSINASPMDTVYITVTARNHLPHEGFTVASAAGPYVTYLKHTILDAAWGNGDNYLNPGETANVEVWLQNAGNVGTHDVYALLSSSDPDITILQDSAFYGDIGVNDSASGLPYYRVRASSGCEAGQAIPVSLQIIDSDGDTWNTSFNFIIYAPALAYNNISIFDFGGDGDRVPEAGETIDIDVSITNTGNLSANYVTGTLNSSDPYVSIVDGNSSFGTIPAGGSATTQSPFKVEISPSCPKYREVEFTLALSTSDGFSDTVEFSFIVGTLDEDMEDDTTGWVHYAETDGYLDEWHLDNYRNHTAAGNFAWKCGGSGPNDYSNYVDAVLVTPEFYLPDSSKLIFWHWMEAETSGFYLGQAYDGGIVLISINGGPFEQIYPDSGYPYTIITGSGNPLPPGTEVFSGTFDWKQEVFDLTGYSGNARIMFRFTTDQGVTREGWYIDDIQIQPPFNPIPHIYVSPSEIDTQAEVGETVVETLVIKNTGTGGLNFEIETDYLLKMLGLKGKQEWIEVDPTSGTVDPGDSAFVQVLMNSTGLQAGTHEATIHVSSNDPSTPVVDVSVTFTVIQLYPDIRVWPRDIDTSANVGEVIYDTIAIANVGDADLEFNIEIETLKKAARKLAEKGKAALMRSTSKDGWIEVVPDAGVVPPGETTFVEVILDGSAVSPGSYSASLFIYNNDPDSSCITVSVDFEVIQPLPEFVRGDVNADGSVDIADGSVLLNHLLPTPDFLCDDAADCDDNGSLTITDAAFLLNHLLPVPSLPEPNQECGVDPTDDSIHCDTFPPCGTKFLPSEALMPTDTLFIGNVVILKHTRNMSAFQIEIYGDIEKANATSMNCVAEDYIFFKAVRGLSKFSIAGLKSFLAHTEEFYTPSGVHKLFQIKLTGEVDSVMAFYVTEDGVKCYPVVVWEDRNGDKVPREFGIVSVCPNPFSEYTDIELSLPVSADFDVQVLDITGRVIKHMHFENETAGIKHVRWFGVDDSGRRINSGVYFLRVVSGELEAIKRVILVR